MIMCSCHYNTSPHVQTSMHVNVHMYMWTKHTYTGVIGAVMNHIAIHYECDCD